MVKNVRIALLLERLTVLIAKIILGGAIDLINRQKAEIERLNNNISAMSITNGGVKE